jgi:FkbM family methyltransferase
MQRVDFSFEGKDYVFHVANPDDAFQKVHLRHALFDYPELKEISKYVKDGDVIADIGANVGNHSVYFSLNYPKARIFPFEPMPEAAEILKLNLEANACANVERKFIGVALSNDKGTAWALRGGPNNLGGTKIIDQTVFDSIPAHQRENLKTRNLLVNVPIRTGDDALGGERVNFIKIDVQELEMKVLSGLQATINRDRPTLFVEVDHVNAAAFDEWIARNRYEPVWIDRHYASAVNYLMLPKD